MDFSQFPQLDENTRSQLFETATMYGMQFVAAVITLIVGFTLAKWASKLAYKGLKRIPEFDEMLARFLQSMVRYAILAFTIVAVLSKFGVQTASLVAVIGAAGLAIGLALQGTLSHIAAGVMLLIFRPFKLGEYVDAGGIAGTVKDMNLFTTELATPDNIQIIVPNGQIWGQAIKNFSSPKTRRVDVVVGIDYSDNIDDGIKIMKDVMKKDKRIQTSPAPMAAVTDLGDNSVNFTVRAWVKTPDFWDVKFDLTKKVKLALDEAGLSIPFPQRTLHIVNGTSADVVSAPKKTETKPAAEKKTTAKKTVAKKTTTKKAS
ncbi:MAG: mechanosensitive ion channel domain-containing protein [Pseudomonadota bacterium]|nr:mechanosensitive ion channel domain-containing protein [Pseudomonadota bacterium]